MHAQLTSDSEQTSQVWDFRITEENGEAELEMDDQNMTICWAYGDREDTSAMGTASQVYVDRQGTDTVYSSLHIRNSIVSSTHATLFNINHAELFAFVGRIKVVFVLPYC